MTALIGGHLTAGAVWSGRRSKTPIIGVQTESLLTCVTPQKNWGTLPCDFPTGRTENRLLATRSDAYLEHNPEGYRLVNGARMKDIAWEKMCALKDAGARAAYECLSEAFRLHDISKLGIIAKLTEDGIAGWDEMFFIKDESLEDYMDRRGATAIDKHPLDVFALVDAQGEWHSSGDMGWFGLVSNEKPAREWKNELELLTEAIDPEDFVVIIDCHI